MNNVLKKPVVTTYTVDPYSARALILKLEREYNLTIRVRDTTHYCMISIDKEERKEDEPVL